MISMRHGRDDYGPGGVQIVICYSIDTASWRVDDLREPRKTRIDAFV